MKQSTMFAIGRLGILMIGGCALLTPRLALPSPPQQGRGTPESMLELRETGIPPGPGFEELGDFVCTYSFLRRVDRVPVPFNGGPVATELEAGKLQSKRRGDWICFSSLKEIPVTNPDTGLSDIVVLLDTMLFRDEELTAKLEQTRMRIGAPLDFPHGILPPFDFGYGMRLMPDDQGKLLLLPISSAIAVAPARGLESSIVTMDGNKVWEAAWGDPVDRSFGQMQRMSQLVFKGEGPALEAIRSINRITFSNGRTLDFPLRETEVVFWTGSLPGGIVERHFYAVPDERFQEADSEAELRELAASRNELLTKELTEYYLINIRPARDTDAIDMLQHEPFVRSLRWEDGTRSDEVEVLDDSSTETIRLWRVNPETQEWEVAP